MDGAVTYGMLSAVFSAIVVVGGAWFFIEKRIVGVEQAARATVDSLERDLKIEAKAIAAELMLFKERIYRDFVSTDALIRFEERVLGELREIRRALNKVNDRNNEE